MSLHISFNVVAWIALVLLGLVALRFIASSAYPSLRHKPDEDPQDDHDQEQARTSVGTFRPPWWTDADDAQVAAHLGLGPNGDPQ